MAQPPFLTDPYPAKPPPPGLFSVADLFETLPDLHAANNGAIWVPDTCGPGEVAAAYCQTPPYSSFVMDGLENIAQAWPVAVYATELTGTYGMTFEERRRRVMQRLALSEQYVVEQVLSGATGMTALFTGIDNYAGKAPGAAPVVGVAGGIFQQLANAGAAAGFTDLGTATDVVDAMSRLEQKAADAYYGEAMIHARPRMAAYLANHGQFRVIGLPPSNSKQPYQYSQNLNPYSLGNGYTGNGPTLQTPDATTEYMWVTGRVCIWRSEDVAVTDPRAILNKTTNQVGMYAVRQYLIGVECFSACIKVTRG